MVVCRDENDGENVQPKLQVSGVHGSTPDADTKISISQEKARLHYDENSDHNVKPSVRTDCKPGGCTDWTPDVRKKLGPSVIQWATRERVEAKTAAGQRKEAKQTGRRHFSSGDVSFKVGSTDVDENEAKQRGRRHFSSGDVSFKVGSTDVDEMLSTKSQSRRKRLSASPLRSSTPSPGGAGWVDSLRESSPARPWKPTMTIPQAPNFSTPNRSRSLSARSCSPGNMTPEESESPRGTSAAWPKSLRRATIHSTTSLRASLSVDSTPERKKKRRSLSNWWAEAEPHHRRRASTPEIRTYAADGVVDEDDGISMRSYASPAQGAKLAAQLSCMSSWSQETAVERKRQELDELSADSLPVEQSVILEPAASCPPISVVALGDVASGTQDWLRSLRQGKSCPPSLQTSSSNAKIHGRFAETSVRTRPSGGAREKPRQTPRRTPREQAALDKHMGRSTVRSCSSQRSRQRSASATPERTATSERQPLQPRDTNTVAASPPHRIVIPFPEWAQEESKHVPMEQSFGVPKCRSEQSSRSATPDRVASTRGTPLSARELNAVAKHLERAAAAADPCGLHKHSVQKPLERKSRSSFSFGQVAPRVRVALDTFTTGSECSIDEEWVRNAASLQERAERRRDMAKSKFDQALAHEKSRVCIFKRPSESG